MRAAVPSTLLVLALGALAPAAAGGQEYYRDIRPLLAERCAGCHSDAGVAFSMEDPEATFRRRRAIAEAVLDRKMPPWLAEPGHQRYVGDLSLDDEQLATVTRWAESGYPKGEPREAVAANGDRISGGAYDRGFTTDLSLDVLAGRPYLPDQERPDDYRCFVVDWPAERPAYVTGFRAVPGNLRVAHHVVVHAVDADMVDRYRELDEAEDGPGYQCFGGAVPDRLGERAERDAYEARHPDGVAELSRGSFWLAHWAPGMDGHTFPEGTGIPLEPGAALVVQMHYYSRHAPGEADQASRVDFQVAEHVERPAFHLPQTREAWLESDENGSMMVPPLGRATYEVSENLGDLLPYLARVTGVDEERVERVEVHSANLHMHGFGHSGVITLTDTDGRKQTLLSVPSWNLAWQRDFTFAEPKVFGADELDGTYITVECTFENTTDRVVYGGYGSDEEMCFNFSYIAVQASPDATDGSPPRGRGPGS